MTNVNIHFIGENDESIKFLGLHLDEHSTWTKHIAAITSNISKSLFAINRVKYALPHCALKYYTFHWFRAIYNMEYKLGVILVLSVRLSFCKNVQSELSIIIIIGAILTHFSNMKGFKKLHTSISYMFPYLCLICNLRHYQHPLSNSFPEVPIMIRVQSLQDSMTTYSDKDQEQHSHQNYRSIIVLRYGIASTNQQEIGKADIYLNVS